MDHQRRDVLGLQLVHHRDRAVRIAAETGGRTRFNGKPITSSAGAIGPMQVMPRTYDELRQRYGLGPDPADPEQNILAGTAYLKELYRRFGRAGMFAAYNAGPERYQAYLEGDLPLPQETKAYLVALGNVLPDTAPQASFPSGKDLFFPLSAENPESTAGPSAPNSNSLFVPLDRPEPGPAAEKKGRRAVARGARLGPFLAYQPGRNVCQGCAVPPKCCAFWLPRTPLRGAGCARVPDSRFAGRSPGPVLDQEDLSHGGYDVSITA
ncbi:MAG: lytic transglycosylase domain-containing protein [Rhodospirillales bacterium]|nr:lytic transglycosylase domain-containing protein [Rhodospirillales bacterium]